ncbi:glycine dehydrogenase subunit 2 [Parelusimicrobium proximum]|uniref:aminomethyl-transferring glycine dehydrogenase subunit GcvPB n=1 Tax=Parelusimicrobium proximum TaxID=3228953 RepID=UPI003D1868AB
MEKIIKHNTLSIEKSVKGRRGIKFTSKAPDASKYLNASMLRKRKANLPELSEFDTVRHFTNLSRLNYCLDTHFYPLGSCTMKYNPKSYEVYAALSGFTQIHPFADSSAVQGSLELMYNLEQKLCAILGMEAFTLQPAAGAHGEWTGVLMAKAYHDSNGDKERTEVVVPDTAHGTNPATANMGGLSVVNIKSSKGGTVDIEALKAVLGPKTALVMLTVPNTVGIFEQDIVEIAKLVHDAGALLYMDGANFNAIMGIAKPADFGIDIIHLNLHKTFSTPHGGGGPGSGAVGVSKRLVPFLPVPRVEKKGDKFELNFNNPLSIGMMKSFYGNIGVLIRAYAYVCQYDGKTLRQVAENAVLNANYIRVKLKDSFPAFFDKINMHECVLTINKDKMNGVRTTDVAKRLLDYGFYAPTIYFPLTVPEAIMIEPTETEGKDMIDKFIEAMTAIFNEAVTAPDLVKNAPESQPIKRIDEVSAAREPNLCWSYNPDNC